MTDADKAGERKGRIHVLSNSQGQWSVVVLSNLDFCSLSLLIAWGDQTKYHS